MKQLTCEMCGGTDLIKQDGVFMCQNCGMKYSVEEAKKMMIEGTVDVQGTVKVDNSSFVEKYLQNARRAKAKEDWAEVEKYYNLVEQNDPKNIEAIFYSAYGKAMLSLVDSDIYKRQQIFNVFVNSISVIDDNYDLEKADENKEIIEGMSYDIIDMSNSSFVYTTRTQNNVTSDNRNETYILFAQVDAGFMESIENIISVDDKLYLYYILAKHCKRIVDNGYVDYNARVKYRTKLLSIFETIKEKDSSFEIPEVPEVPEPSGCYVATCVYGSYDCPQVWTLRRYRDFELAETWYGRLFIKTYYAISPTLVKWFGNTEWFKKMWKGTLDSMVARLQEQGFEDTKYEDRKW